VWSVALKLSRFWPFFSLHPTRHAIMSADRLPYDLTASPDEIEDAEAILQDLEKIIFETLPPTQAEAAYVAALKHLLKLIGGDAILATDRLFERAIRVRATDRTVWLSPAGGVRQTWLERNRGPA
jgi:hypothetical protein